MRADAPGGTQPSTPRTGQGRLCTPPSFLRADTPGGTQPRTPRAATPVAARK